MEWYPIATCPKNGRRFLAIDACDVYAVVFVDPCGEIVVSWDVDPFGVATHWAELPIPPKE